MGAKNSTEMSNTEKMWNNIKTENMSATAPNISGLSNDAKQLIAKLNLPEFTDAETSEFNVNKILGIVNTNLNEEDQRKFHQILDQMVPSSYNENFSETSSFISDEMYNKLIHANKMNENIMTGGAFHSNEEHSHKASKEEASIFLRGGASDITKSSTSST